jgi:hypothetical protein
MGRRQNKEDRELKEVLELEREILERLEPHRLTQRISIRFTGEITMANNAVTLNVGQKSTASIQPLLADGVTPSGGTLSNVSYAFVQATTAATVDLNSDGVTALVTGVSNSSGTILGTATATVTDTDGAVTTLSQSFTVTVNAPAPQQLTQSIQVQFTAPA